MVIHKVIYFVFFYVVMSCDFLKNISVNFDHARF